LHITNLNLHNSDKKTHTRR